MDFVDGIYLFDKLVPTKVEGISFILFFVGFEFYVFWLKVIFDVQ